MAPLNFIQDIYNESFDRIELLKRLDIASNSQLIKISMIPFGCENDPENYLSRRYTRRKGQGFGRYY
jgi:hypothetical protein